MGTANPRLGPPRSVSRRFKTAPPLWYYCGMRPSYYMVFACGTVLAVTVGLFLVLYGNNFDQWVVGVAGLLLMAAASVAVVVWMMVFAVVTVGGRFRKPEESQSSPEGQ